MPDIDDDDEDLIDETEDENQAKPDEESGPVPEATAGQDEQPAAGEEGAEPEVRDEPRQVSRGEARFQKLSNQAREANERSTRLERELQEMRAERQRQQAQVQEKEPTPEEMSLWSTDQVVQYRLEKATGKFNNTLQQMQFQNAEANDQSSYRALCTTDARAKRYADEVETRLTDLRRQGQNVSREVLLKYIIGEKVMAKSAQSVPAARKKGERNIARQQSNSSPPRSDNQGGRQAKTEAEKRRERLENLTF